MRFIAAALHCITILAIAPSPGAADPIRLYPISAVSSDTAPGFPTSNVSNRKLDDFWTAGGRPSQWIRLDLGRSVSLSRIRLRVAQNAAGATVHRLYVGQTPESMRLVRTFSEVTRQGQWLTHELADNPRDHLGDVRYVRVTTTSGPSRVAWAEIEVYQSVEYLGYFASSWEQMGDYTDETAAAGANLTWVRPMTSGSVRSLLHGARNARVKAALQLDAAAFFNNNAAIKPYADWRQRWAAVRDSLRSNSARGGYENDVAAIFLMDEPYHNAAADKVSAENMRSWLGQMAAAVRKDFPDIPVGVILATPTLVSPRADGSYVSMFDWVGFDCYGPWRSCAGRPMSRYIATLRSWLKPEHRMIVVPEAFLSDAGPLMNNRDAVRKREIAVVASLSSWQQEILGDGRYVAVIPFLWQTMDVHSNGITDIGAGRLPLVRERIHQLSREYFDSPGTRPRDVP